MFEHMAKRAAAAVFLTVTFFQMALGQDAGKKPLHCYNCSYNFPCAEIPTQCHEGERCGIMVGHSDYKVHDSIFGKGCVPAKKCGTQERIKVGDNPFRVSYSCCDTDFCNKDVVVETDHKIVTAAGHASFPTQLPWLLAIMLLAALPTFLS